MRPPCEALLACTLCASWILQASASADFGAWTKGLRGDSTPLAKATLIAGCVLSFASICFLIAAWLQFSGKFVPRRWCGDFGHPAKHIVLAVLWLPVVAIAAYLLSRHHMPSVAFLAAGLVFVCGHVATAAAQLCGCCCGGGLPGVPADHAKSALLTAQNCAPGRHGASSGGSASPAGAHADASANAFPAGRNPFYATYGLLPGSSSVFAYQIFIPGTDEEQAAAAAACNYTGLQSGPHGGRGARSGRVAAVRGPILQPLSPTQEMASHRLQPGMASA